jgi:hypothetical protein
MKVCNVQYWDTVIYKRSGAIVDAKIVTQRNPDDKPMDAIFAYAVSDDSVERVADVKRPGAITFCSGLDT